MLRYRSSQLWSTWLLTSLQCGWFSVLWISKVTARSHCFFMVSMLMNLFSSEHAACLSWRLKGSVVTFNCGRPLLIGLNCTAQSTVSLALSLTLSLSHITKLNPSHTIHSLYLLLGSECLKRKEGQPGTLFGWQGIVPAKVKKMGGDIFCHNGSLKARDGWGKREVKTLMFGPCFWLDTVFVTLVFRREQLSVVFSYPIRHHHHNYHYQHYHHRNYYCHHYHHHFVPLGDIADTLLNNLLDLKLVFSRIDSTKLCSLLTPSLVKEVDLIIKREGILQNILIRSFASIMM